MTKSIFFTGLKNGKNVFPTISASTLYCAMYQDDNHNNDDNHDNHDYHDNHEKHDNVPHIV